MATSPAAIKAVPLLTSAVPSIRSYSRTLTKRRGSHGSVWPSDPADRPHQAVRELGDRPGGSACQRRAYRHAVGEIAKFSPAVISTAANGLDLPTPDLLAEYVRGCGGNEPPVACWLDRRAAEHRRAASPVSGDDTDEGTAIEVTGMQSTVLGDTARMSRQTWIVIALAVSAVAGCSSAPKAPRDNTAAVCADYLTTTEQFLKESPEGRAVSDAMTREYKGNGDQADTQRALTTFNKAFGARLKPLADKATKPELKNALTKLSDAYSAGRSDVAAVKEVADVCPDPSSSPSGG